MQFSCELYTHVYIRLQSHCVTWLYTLRGYCPRTFKVILFQRGQAQRNRKCGVDSVILFPFSAILILSISNYIITIFIIEFINIYNTQVISVFLPACCHYKEWFQFCHLLPESKQTTSCFSINHKWLWNVTFFHAL